MLGALLGVSAKAKAREISEISGGKSGLGTLKVRSFNKIRQRMAQESLLETCKTMLMVAGERNMGRKPTVVNTQRRVEKAQEPEPPGGDGDTACGMKYTDADVAN